MSFFKVIISLPIIAAKLAWRFALIVLISFPVTGFFIVPAIENNNLDSLMGMATVMTVIALIISIRVWVKSHENVRYGEHWKW